MKITAVKDSHSEKKDSSEKQDIFCKTSCSSARATSAYSEELRQLLESFDQHGVRVEETVKESSNETTQRVLYAGKQCIRKVIKTGGRRTGYDLLFDLQREGVPLQFVPRILDLKQGSDSEEVFIEYLEVPSLRDLILEEPLSRDAVNNIFLKICDAVIELHSQNLPIIHRDIKPSNILTNGTNVWIIDFGISRAYDALQNSDTTVFGTQGFAPPEQFGFGQTDVRSDLYQLAQTYYFMVAGHQAEKPLTKIENLDELFGKNVANVLRKASSFDPDMRQPNVLQFKQEILIALQNDFTAAASAGTIRGKVLEVREALRGKFQSAGIIWNAFLVVLFIVLLYVCCKLAFVHQSPSVSSTASADFAFNVAIYMIGFVPFCFFILFAFYDKRRISKRLKFFQEHAVIKSLALIGIGIVWLFSVASLLVALFYFRPI